MRQKAPGAVLRHALQTVYLGEVSNCKGTSGIVVIQLFRFFVGSSDQSRITSSGCTSGSGDLSFEGESVPLGKGTLAARVISSSSPSMAS